MMNATLQDLLNTLKEAASNIASSLAGPQSTPIRVRVERDDENRACFLNQTKRFK